MRRRKPVTFSFQLINNGVSTCNPGLLHILLWNYGSLLRYFCHLIFLIVPYSSTDCSESVQGIELKSSLENDNRTAACPGETVVHTCSVLNTGVLQWAVESFHSYTTESIIQTVQFDSVGSVEVEQDGRITAQVTDTSPHMVFWGNITSTLTLLAHESFHNKRVWCGNGFTYEIESACFLHKYGGYFSSCVFL